MLIAATERELRGQNIGFVSVRRSRGKIDNFMVLRCTFKIMPKELLWKRDSLEKQIGKAKVSLF